MDILPNNLQDHAYKHAIAHILLTIQQTDVLMFAHQTLIIMAI
jgi:hypothetical protein